MVEFAVAVAVAGGQDRRVMETLQARSGRRSPQSTGSTWDARARHARRVGRDRAQMSIGNYCGRWLPGAVGRLRSFGARRQDQGETRGTAWRLAFLICRWRLRPRLLRATILWRQTGQNPKRIARYRSDGAALVPTTVASESFTVAGRTWPRRGDASRQDGSSEAVPWGGRAGGGGQSAAAMQRASCDAMLGLPGRSSDSSDNSARLVVPLDTGERRDPRSGKAGSGQGGPAGLPGTVSAKRAER